MKNFKIKPLILAVAAVSAGIAGCGGTGQDEGSSSRVSVSGLSLDAYIASAEVFQDINADGVRQAFEPRAFTDDMGYYSYNPTTTPATNYCAETTAADLREKHCLMAMQGNYPIVIQGGYDLLTGEPFKGILRKNVNVQPNRQITSLDIVSPVTTVLSYANSEAEQTTIKNLLGVDDPDLNRDFFNRDATVLNQTADNASDLRMLNVTQKLQKLVSVSTQMADRIYSVKDESSLPISTSSYIYKSLANQLAQETSPTSTLDISLNTANISTILTNARNAIRADYTQKNIMPPSNTTSTLFDGPTITKLTKIAPLVNDVFINSSSVSLDANTRGGVKILELAEKKITNNNTLVDLDQLVTAVQTPTTLTTLNTELAKPTTSVQDLVNIDVSNTTNVTTITSSTDSNTAAFLQLQNKQLAVGDSEVAQDVRNTKDYAAILYFRGDSEQATSGTLIACVRYVEGLKYSTSSNGSGYQLESGSTLGTFTDLGTWSVLNEGYNLLISFEIANAVHQATVQYLGGTEGNYSYRTDIGDELRSWSGLTLPVATTADLPTSDTDCKNRLDSAVPMNSQTRNALSPSA